MEKDCLSREEQIGLYRGMLSSHLGRLFTMSEVFPTKIPHKLSRIRKKIWWKLYTPIQFITHKNCQKCKELRQVIKELEGREANNG